MLRLVEIAVTVGWCLIWAAALAFVAWLSKGPKRNRALLITCVAFALPLVWWWGSYPYYEYVAKRDYEVFKELCAKHAGDKIYRRVEEVDAVFQMKARNPDGEITHRRNQYTMEDPFGALGDLGSGNGPDSFIDWRSGSEFYKAIERPKVLRESGPPYIRYEPIRNGEVRHGRPRFVVHESQVDILTSKYGYSWEDISTEDMRARWIAGGRIRIVSLSNGELLAERTGFMYVRTQNGAITRHPWSGAHSTCPPQQSTNKFVKSILVPSR